jgi:hypothetical protein
VQGIEVLFLCRIGDVKRKFWFGFSFGVGIIIMISIIICYFSLLPPHSHPDESLPTESTRQARAALLTEVEELLAAEYLAAMEAAGDRSPLAWDTERANANARHVWEEGWFFFGPFFCVDGGLLVFIRALALFLISAPITGSHFPGLQTAAECA